MPKKFKGENSKAVEARARKATQKDEEELRKQEQLEDEYWKDDDKHLQKKLQRKEDKEKKKTEQLERKKEAQKILDEEQAAIASKPGSKAGPPKLTRAEAEVHRLNVAEVDKAAVAATAKVNVQEQEPEIEENVNRIVIEGDHARTVEEALSVLGVGEGEVDMHPEKRMRAAYLAFEEKNLPILKQENPNLRLSQLKQLLKKDWAKSPENPLNQRLAAADAKK